MAPRFALLDHAREPSTLRRGRRARRSLGVAAVALGCTGVGMVGLSAPAHGAVLRSWRTTRSAGAPEPSPPVSSSAVPASTTTTEVPSEEPERSPAPTAPAAGPAEQGTAVPTVRVERTFTDTTRATPARGDVRGTDSRVVRTLIVRPASSGTPLPVVVFAPGYDSTPERYLPLLQAWAAAGYEVVAPDSPGSAADLPGTPTRDDIANQAQDLSFALTQVLADPSLPSDPDRVAAAGHSDGGTAVAILALDGGADDGRISSYLVLSGATPDGARAVASVQPAEHALAVVGDQDEYGNLGATTALYARLSMDKTLIVASGGDHLGTYIDDTALAASVRQATVQFLDTSLEGSGIPSLRLDGAVLHAVHD